MAHFEVTMLSDGPPQSEKKRDLQSRHQLDIEIIR